MADATGAPKSAPAPEADDVQPLDVDGVGAVAVGTVLWLVALVALLPFRDRLAANDATWWLWVCVAGAVLGLLGLPYVIRRRNAYRRHRAAAQAVAPEPGPASEPGPATDDGQAPPRSITS